MTHAIAWFGAHVSNTNYDEDSEFGIHFKWT